MTNVFIDGSAGTTGLRIYDRLSTRDDISLIKLPEELRKDDNARAQAINSADIVFLCLPDDAARQAVTFVKNDKTAIIDTSTAHRTNDDWVYGFPELTLKREQIINSKRIANPGCHASGFIALVKPLIEAGVLSGDAALSCFSITGYSGGGKKMIADYESADKSALLKAPRQYGLTQQHKHLKEMQFITGVETPPAFCPIVADFYSGMEVTVTLFKHDIKANIDDIKAIYKNYYTGKLVHFDDTADEAGFLSAAALSGKDDMQLCVFGNEDRIILVARYDNLGKGASGAAIQNMNILMGVDETTGLIY
ncbi:MAG: N-acetyl-gamma-glutamyl-phosphate reductase [Ruminococcaceae bacterium]|nr:N-acetyl-gamma-glutamyl-phosphate reductase [Oscillospiraceae bacterium]